MQYLGAFGRSMASRYSGSKAGKLGKEVVDAAGVGFGAFGMSYLAALDRMKTAKAGKQGGGELMGVPYTLVGAVVLGAASLAGVGGGHLMNAAKGSLAAYAATAGIKLAFSGSGQTPSIGALGNPQEYVLSGGPYYGATPETEALFREAGV